MYCVAFLFLSSKNSVRSFGSCCITELSCSVRFLWVMITWTSSSTLSRFRIFRKKVKGLLISVLLLYSVLTYHLHHALNAVALSEAIHGFTELCALWTHLMHLDFSISLGSERDHGQRRRDAEWWVEHIAGVLGLRDLRDLLEKFKREVCVCCCQCLHCLTYREWDKGVIGVKTVFHLTVSF